MYRKKLILHRNKQHVARSGSMLTELIVAAGLLVTSISLLATTTVAGLKFHRLERQQEVATDELSNQLEQILALPSEDVATAAAQLEISSWALHTLPAAHLNADLIDDEYGKRVELKIDWQRTGDSKPLVAVGWLNATAAPLADPKTIPPGDAHET
jgi:hypothetical protein